MSHRSATERHIHQEQRFHELCRVNSILDAMRRGEDHLSIIARNKKIVEIGQKSEDIVLEAFSKHPRVKDARKANLAEDINECTDIVADVIREDGKVWVVAVQVKSGNEQLKKYRYGVMRQNHLKNERQLDAWFVSKNKMAIKPGNCHQTPEERVMSVWEQLNSWIQRKEEMESRQRY